MIGYRIGYRESGKINRMSVIGSVVGDRYLFKIGKLRKLVIGSGIGVGDFFMIGTSLVIIYKYTFSYEDLRVEVMNQSDL